eukprot:CAMPEP_0194103584 /NCGR_PEP_ID=MMETSP0150-20130528/4011_1 /TAXON_ID=122233 /ORGANISM="Chaetoceros debilis, Strain MM31A-1" /LENGTH=837 /DNA_ID=CAMNT_0038790861 /DNA_START=104 /DNA_END=2617 /DNA_ORIENTATION=+
MGVQSLETPEGIEYFTSQHHHRSYGSMHGDGRSYGSMHGDGRSYGSMHGDGEVDETEAYHLKQPIHVGTTCSGMHVFETGDDDFSIQTTESEKAPNSTCPLNIHMGGNVRSLLCRFTAAACILLYSIFVALGKYELHIHPLLGAGSICTLLCTTNNTNIKRKRSRLGSTFISRISKAFCCKSQQQHTATGPFENTSSNMNMLSCSKRGDPNMNRINILLVLLPCLVYGMRSVGGHMADNGFEFNQSLHKHVANDFGKLSAFAMSAFLVPVARHSILLECLGLDPRYGLRVHIFSGCIAVVTGLGHGIYWFFIWMLVQKKEFWEIIPSGDCWTKTRHDHEDCSAQFVNLLGILCGVCFIGLSVTSLWWIRRNYYRFFYVSHIVFSILLFYGLAMHYNKMILYLAPSLVYYLASCVPALVQAFRSWSEGGALITKVVHIPDSRDCVELSIQMDEHHKLEESLCGKYVRVCVPEISKVWHPFTVYSDQDDPHNLKLTFRCTGPFTQDLSDRLSLTKSSGVQNPKFLVDGFYGAEDRLSNALDHETIVIVAGGVGIVSYISLLNKLRSTTRSSINSETTFQTNRIILHWTCRDEGLIRYVKENYLDFKDEDFRNFPLSLYIHHTHAINNESTLCAIDKEDNMNYDNEWKGQEIVPRGKPFVPYQLSSGHRKIAQNLPAAILFSLLTWGNLWIILYFYKNVQTKKAVLSRIYVLISMSLYSIILSGLGLLILQWASQHSYSSVSTADNCGDSSTCTKNKDDASTKDISVSTEGSSDDFSFDLENQPISYQIKHSQGRPEFNEDSFDLPDTCVFVCGPASLLKSVRECCKSDNCAIYEEIFEM